MKQHQRWLKYVENPVNLQKKRIRDKMRKRIKRNEEKMKDEKISKCENKLEFWKILSHNFIETYSYPQTNINVDLEFNSLLEKNDVSIKDQLHWFDKVEKKVKEFMEKDLYWHKVRGLDRDDFDELVSEMTPYFENLTWEGIEKINRSKKLTLSSASALFITLFFFRQYVTGIVMELVFDCGESTLAKVCKKTLMALELTFQGQQQAPTPNELLKMIDSQQAGKPLEKVVAVVDGTVIRSFRSQLKYKSGKNDPYFNVHKKYPGLNMLVIVDLQGRILWNTPTYPGAVSDQSIWNSEKLRKWFEETEVGVIGDRGFTFNIRGQQHSIIGFTPFPLNAVLQNDEESKNKMKFNIELSKRRVIIENTFKRLNDWKIIWFTLSSFPSKQRKKSKTKKLF